MRNLLSWDLPSKILPYAQLWSPQGLVSILLLTFWLITYFVVTTSFKMSRHDLCLGCYVYRFNRYSCFWTILSQLLAMAILVIMTVPMTFLGNCFLEVVHGWCGANCSHTHTAILCEFKEWAVGQLSGVKLWNSSVKLRNFFRSSSSNCSHPHTAILCEIMELAVGQLSGVKWWNWLWDSYAVWS